MQLKSGTKILIKRENQYNKIFTRSNKIKINLPNMLERKNNFEIFRDLSLPVEKSDNLYGCIKNFVILKK